MSIRDHLRRQQLRRLHEQAKASQNRRQEVSTGDIPDPNDVYRPLDSWVAKPQRRRTENTPVEPLPKKELKPAVPETISQTEAEEKAKKYPRVLSFSLSSGDLNEINLYLKRTYGADAYGKRSQWIRETLLAEMKRGQKERPG